MSVVLVFVAALAGFCVRLGVLHALVRSRRRLAEQLTAERLRASTNEGLFVYGALAEHRTPPNGARPYDQEAAL